MFMGITTILFDLDGTLLPMDQVNFVNTYLGLLAKKLAPFGYDPKTLVDAVWQGTKAMMKNDGTRTNADAFWDTFCGLMGSDCRTDEPLFQEFYENEFSQVSQVCGRDPRAAAVIALLKSKGLRTALATNPLFPKIATQQRITWAGLSPDDFELYTTYEDHCWCKPNAGYYQAVLDRLGVKAEECVMVGNDVGEDMTAAKLGMQVFLLTDCMLNPKGLDTSRYPQGNFDDLLAFIEHL